MSERHPLKLPRPYRLSTACPILSSSRKRTRLSTCLNFPGPKSLPTAVARDSARLVPTSLLLFLPIPPMLSGVRIDLSMQRSRRRPRQKSSVVFARSIIQFHFPFFYTADDDCRKRRLMFQNMGFKFDYETVHCPW
jgi:hypothetical protein